MERRLGFENYSSRFHIIPPTPPSPPAEGEWKARGTSTVRWPSSASSAAPAQAAPAQAAPAPAPPRSSPGPGEAGQGKLAMVD